MIAIPPTAMTISVRIAAINGGANSHAAVRSPRRMATVTSLRRVTMRTNGVYAVSPVVSPIPHPEPIAIEPSCLTIGCPCSSDETPGLLSTIHQAFDCVRVRFVRFPSSLFAELPGNDDFDRTQAHPPADWTPLQAGGRRFDPVTAHSQTLSDCQENTAGRRSTPYAPRPCLPLLRARGRLLPPASVRSLA
jgi:hypothetical protein